MPRQNSSKQIAAHFTQTYIEDGRDADVLHEFSQVLEKRMHTLKGSENRKLYQDVGSLLYCVRDLKGSCRDLAESVSAKDVRNCSQHLNRASLRVREIGQQLTDLRQNHPEEYKNSCREFVSQWKQMEFEKGGEVLRLSGAATPLKSPENAPKTKENSKKDLGPVPGL